MLEQHTTTPVAWPDYTDSAPELLTLVKGFLEEAHAKHKLHRGEPVKTTNKGSHRLISCDAVLSQVQYRPDRYNALRFDFSLYLGHGLYGTISTISVISALRQELLSRVGAVVDQSKFAIMDTGFEAVLSNGSLSVLSEMKAAGAVLKAHLWVRASALDPTLRPEYSFVS
ncbi:hypothetical protein C1X53_12835 [Pseudomonas sp. GW456-E6]|nr:hypothetical protein C1X55_29850 [Pseudomonas sp. GW460-C8]PMW23430.1 hypothetical protein C1X53_12835 [Pseudomonas sp. GW456-E6]PMW62692.1 hypothetical protein C1X39_03480 [Pseudomonas sp. GW456-12-1-14-TSB1]PMW80100.1 hypothetical protein C1X36_08825 [Pseudomonas sp. GW460-8]PMY22994.1 hypothetical protein C1X54_05595 [Pseudomonas sp. GW460-13]